jgi:hypothetical protein
MKFKEFWPTEWNLENLAESYVHIVGSPMPVNQHKAYEVLKSVIDERVQNAKKEETRYGYSCFGVCCDPKDYRCFNHCLDFPVCLEIYNKRDDIKDSSLVIEEEQND